MGFLGKFIVYTVSNAIGLYVAHRFISGVLFTDGTVELIVAGIILALINLTIRPILRLVFGPIIFLTLGLFMFVINAITLYILDILVDALTIQGFLPLLYASIVIGLLNFVFEAFGKSK